MNLTGRLRSCSFILGLGSVFLPIFPNVHNNSGGDHLLFHYFSGDCLVVACGIQFYLYVSYRMANFNRDAVSLEWVSAHCAAFLIVLLSLSAVPFSGYGAVLFLFLKFHGV